MQTSGAITFGQIGAEFNATRPYLFSQFRAGGPAGVHAQGAPNVPSNANGMRFSQFYGAFKLQPPAVSSIPSLSGSTASAAYTYQPAQTNARAGALVWSISGHPAGVSINSATGLITAGAGTQVNHTITVTATGPTGLSASRTFSMVMAGAASTSGWANTSNPIIAWAVPTNTANQYFAIPANSLADITNRFNYFYGGVNYYFGGDTYVAVSGGVVHNGVTYTGYVRSAAWQRGNTSYNQYVSRNGTQFTTTELTAMNNRTFAGPFV